jgi:hypothetical protein
MITSPSTIDSTALSGRLSGVRNRSVSNHTPLQTKILASPSNNAFRIIGSVESHRFSSFVVAWVIFVVFIVVI